MTPKSKLPKILIISEDGDTVREVRDLLKSRGYLVSEVPSTAKAESAIKKSKPDLIVIDQAHSQENHLDFLKRIRKLVRYTGFIFLSDKENPVSMKNILDSGADDCIHLPINDDEFLARTKLRLHFKGVNDKYRLANQKLKELSETDDVTDLLNMRSMYQKISYVLKQGMRYQRLVCCVMLDIDFFKQANDTHDHLFGSYVLKELGVIIKKTIRDTDFAARYGGDEFLIVLTETSAEGALLFAERLRLATARHVFEDGKDSMQITLSIGLAVTQFSETVDAKTLVRRADTALYSAKNSGRNKVCIYGDTIK